LWVPVTLQTSCDLRVFVQDPAEPVMSDDASGRVGELGREGSQRCGLPQGTVGSVGVDLRYSPRLT
jgi:hypothetical protein